MNRLNMEQLCQSAVQDTYPNHHLQTDRYEIDSYSCVLLLSRSFNKINNDDNKACFKKSLC